MQGAVHPILDLIYGINYLNFNGIFILNIRASLAQTRQVATGRSPHNPPHTQRTTHRTRPAAHKERHPHSHDAPWIRSTYAPGATHRIAPDTIQPTASHIRCSTQTWTQPLQASATHSTNQPLPYHGAYSLLRSRSTTYTTCHKHSRLPSRRPCFHRSGNPGEHFPGCRPPRGKPTYNTCLHICSSHTHTHIHAAP